MISAKMSLLFLTEKSMILKIIIASAFVVVLLFSLETHSQQVTFLFRHGTYLDEMPIAALETTNGDYVVVARQGIWPPSTNSYNVLFLKLDSDGDSTDSAIIPDPKGNCYINSLIADTGGQFFGVGTFRQSATEMSIWLIKMDENLNLLWEKVYQTNCELLGTVQGFVNSFNELIIYGDGYTGVSTYDDLFILKVSETGDSITCNFYPDAASERTWIMVENQNTGNYLLMIFGRYQINTNSWGQILTVEYDLNITGIDAIPWNLFLYHNLILLNGSLVLSGIKIISQASNALNLLGIVLSDTSYVIQTADTLGSMDPDTLSYPGYISNLDTTISHTLYYGGTFHQDNYLVFSYYDSWILLARYDYNLNLIWQKFYGGDLYYGLWGLRATSDGGCLLLCSTFDDQVQTDERDILIMKVDSNGIITGSDTPPGIRIQDAILCPNPGDAYCVAILAAQQPEATLLIYDLSGRIMLEQQLNQYRTRILTAELPAGTYVYQFLSREKIIGSGKWVKR
jgi:hypothetical protein